MPEKNKTATLYFTAMPQQPKNAYFAHGAEYPARWTDFPETINKWLSEGIKNIILYNHDNYPYVSQLRRILRGRGFTVKARRSDAGTKRRVTFKSRLKRIFRGV